jgi:thymidine phosphorylase
MRNFEIVFDKFSIGGVLFNVFILFICTATAAAAAAAAAVTTTAITTTASNII